MAQKVFGKRGQPVDVRPDRVASGRLSQLGRSVARREGSWAFRAVLGAACTAVVALLFHNLQRISDAAPQAIRDSDTPGLVGLPVAILAAVWFLIIPLWFVITVCWSPIRRRSAPNPFAVGAFVAMGAYFASIRFP